MRSVDRVRGTSGGYTQRRGNMKRVSKKRKKKRETKEKM